MKLVTSFVLGPGHEDHVPWAWTDAAIAGIEGEIYAVFNDSFSGVF